MVRRKKKGKQLDFEESAEEKESNSSIDKSLSQSPDSFKAPAPKDKKKNKKVYIVNHVHLFVIGNVMK